MIAQPAQKKKQMQLSPLEINGEAFKLPVSTSRAAAPPSRIKTIPTSLETDHKFNFYHVTENKPKLILRGPISSAALMTPGPGIVS